MKSQSVNASDLPTTLESPGEERTAFLRYPGSTLSPRIVPNDLSTFKTRGISQVQKETAQRLVELRETYMKTVDEFNWNKLVYESDFGFEPVVGETYHLYGGLGSKLRLSLIGPGEWQQKFVASVRMNYGGQWETVDISPDFDLNEHIALVELDRADEPSLTNR